jgi:hypothetical protein
MTTLRAVLDAGTAGSAITAAGKRIASHLVGRERELRLTLAAAAGGRDTFLEGNADLTPANLIPSGVATRAKRRNEGVGACWT